MTTPGTAAGPTRYAMVGDLNNRHMEARPDGNYVLWSDYAEARAAALDAWAGWIDELRRANSISRTAAARGFAAIDALRERSD